MNSLAIIIASTIGIIAIAGLGIASYYRGPNLIGQTVRDATPTPAVSSLPAEDISQAPTSAPETSPAATPTFYPLRTGSQVQGTATIKPSPRPSPAPSPAPVAKIAPPTPAAATNLTLSFVDTPAQVRSGQSFEVHWQVTGPAGTAGESTRLQLSYDAASSSGNSSSSVSSNNSTSFGSFTVPKVFSSTFSFGNEPGSLHLTATAEVNGQTLRATKTIQLTP